MYITFTYVYACIIYICTHTHARTHIHPPLPTHTHIAQALAETVAKIKQEVNRRDMFKVVAKRLIGSATGLATIMAGPPLPVPLYPKP